VFEATLFDRENVVLIQTCGHKNTGSEKPGTGETAFLYVLRQLAEEAWETSTPLTFSTFKRDLTIVITNYSVFQYFQLHMTLC
jgi:hypothetical protein